MAGKRGFIVSWFHRNVIAGALFLIAFSSLSQGFKSVTELTPAAIVKNTAEKPQSKVWNYDGKWWAVFSVSGGTYVWRLDGTSWTNVLKISSSTSVEADCKVFENVCHIFLSRKAHNPSQLISVEYNDASKSYELWSERSSTAYIELDSGVETGTIDIDGTGRMWLASDGINDIRVRWSDPPYETWNGPYVVATGVTDDDICAIIALPGQGQTGILWSDQNSKRFGFRTHDDGSPPTSWSVDEVPASQSALDVGKGMGDDHLNMAVSTDGTLYCAVKTSYDTPGYPSISLLKRHSGGSWDDLYEVSPSGTRGIVILKDAAGTLRVVYAAQEGGGDILYRESLSSTISFGPPFTLIKGSWDNATSAKNNYSSDIVILASDNTTIVGVLASDPELTVALGPSPSLPGEVSVSIYPNPVREILNIEFQSRPEQAFCISIADLLGRNYLTTPPKAAGGKMEIDLRSLQLSSGPHFLMIRSGKHARTIRFIKQ